MRDIIFGIAAILILSMTVQSCGDEIKESFVDYTEDEYALISERLNLPIGAYDYSTDFDENFFINNAGQEEVEQRRDNHKATLGRVLFYDPQLSINESVSCASCHKQNLAFADDVAFSEGFDGEVTTRNSLPLGNTIGFETAYGGPGGARFGWDESNRNISFQSKAAIISEIEMGLDMPTLVERIRKDEMYAVLFKKGFGISSISENRILEALEEFVNSITSSESKFDEETAEVEGQIFSDYPGFSAQENRGKRLYIDHCATCHSIDHKFTAIPVANNGLDLEYEDKGIGAATSNESKNGVFKVPFLRNIELTAPYMHDGRFATLREVIDHYSEGIADHPNLSSILRSGIQPVKMNFSEEDKIALEAYLKTLTDPQLMEDVRFSDPFK